MHRRDVLVQTILSLLIPFYIIYWSYTAGKEIETVYKFKAPNVLLLFAPMIIMIAAFIGLVAGGALEAGDTGNFMAGLGFFFVILVLLPLSSILSLIYYYQFSGIIEKMFGPQQTSRMLLFVLFWFAPPAAVYIIQEKLNTLSTSPQQWQPQTPQTVSQQNDTNFPPPQNPLI